MSNTAAFFFTEHDNSYAARTGRPNDVGVIGVAVFRERRMQPPIQPMRPIRPYGEQRYEPSPYGSAGSPGAADTRDAVGSLSAAAPQQGGRADAANNAPPPASAPAEAYGDMAPRRAEKSLGTGHGRIEQSETRYTDFQRASTTPEQVLTLYYDTYSNLLAMGVPVWRDGGNRYSYKPQPRPFPRDPTLGFAPDPR
jgi:hypothetical protein